MIMMVALGTSTPTSITVVATRILAIVALEASPSPSALAAADIRPWTRATWSPNIFFRSANRSSADTTSSASLSSTSGQYPERLRALRDARLAAVR